MLPIESSAKPTNCFLVEFIFPGPFANTPGVSDGVDSATWGFNDLIESRLQECGFNWQHAYAWSDGSCYKQIRTQLNREDLLAAVNRALIPTVCKAVRTFKGRREAFL